MKKNIVLLCEDLEEIEKLKRWLINDNYIINAATTLVIKPSALLEHTMDLLLVYTMYDGMSSVMDLYETMRTSEKLKSVPIIVITDMDTQKTLAENIVLVSARILSTAVTEDNLVNIVSSLVD